MPQLRDKYPYILANEAVYANTDLKVTDKYTGEVATSVALADASVIEKGIQASVDAAEALADMPTYERQAVLEHCVTRFRELFDELSYALCVEAGKPINDARGRSRGSLIHLRLRLKRALGLTGSFKRLISAHEQRGIEACGRGCRLDRARLCLHLTSR